MKRLLTSFIGALALSGCLNFDPDKTNNDTTNLDVPVFPDSVTFEISDSNALSTMSTGFSAAFASLEYATLGDVSTNSATRRSIRPRGTVTDIYDCDSGRRVVTIDAPDSFFEANTLPETGTMTFSFGWSKCMADDGLVDGLVTTDFSWAGSLDNVTSTTTFEELVSSTTSGDSYVDGEFTLSLGETEQSLSWDLTISAPSLSGATVRTYTSVPFTQGNNDSFPSAGEIVFVGANGSQATATVVSGGYDISINGAQAVFYSFEELADA